MKPLQGFDYTEDARGKGRVTGRAGFGNDRGTGQTGHPVLNVVGVTAYPDHPMPDGPLQQGHTESVCV